MYIEELVKFIFSDSSHFLLVLDKYTSFAVYAPFRLEPIATDIEDCLYSLIEKKCMTSQLWTNHNLKYFFLDLDRFRENLAMANAMDDSVVSCYDFKLVLTVVPNQG